MAPSRSSRSMASYASWWSGGNGGSPVRRALAGHRRRPRRQACPPRAPPARSAAPPRAAGRRRQTPGRWARAGRRCSASTAGTALICSACAMAGSASTSHTPTTIVPPSSAHTRARRTASSSEAGDAAETNASSTGACNDACASSCSDCSVTATVPLGGPAPSVGPGQRARQDQPRPSSEERSFGAHFHKVVVGGDDAGFGVERRPRDVEHDEVVVGVDNLVLQLAPVRSALSAAGIDTLAFFTVKVDVTPRGRRRALRRPPSASRRCHRRCDVIVSL